MLAMMQYFEMDLLKVTKVFIMIEPIHRDCIFTVYYFGMHGDSPLVSPHSFIGLRDRLLSRLPWISKTIFVPIYVY